MMNNIQIKILQNRPFSRFFVYLIQNAQLESEKYVTF